MFPDLTLILGGASSGKSSFAENLMLNSGLDRVYLATAQAHDDEMRARIVRHRTDRGGAWRTVEAPMDAADALGSVTSAEAVLLDCATMWLTNQLLAEQDLDAAEAVLIAALTECAGPVVIVSNEVGMGIVPDNALSRRFREAQGGLNQRLAARADLVVTVMAGLPMVLKGTLPGGLE